MDEVQTETRRPVLICSCFYPTPPPLETVVNTFTSLGHEVQVVPWRLEDMADVVSYARHIAACGRALAEKHGAPINIVAHSMGGVAALYAVKRLGLSSIVSRMVAFGSPFRGTPIAYASFFNPIFFNLGLQLAPGSAFLNDLASDPLPSEVHVVSVSGSRDRICARSETALAGSVQQDWPFSHTDFMFSVILHRRVDIFLE